VFKDVAQMAALGLKGDVVTLFSVALFVSQLKWPYATGQKNNGHNLEVQREELRSNLSV
jgi:hypothetical protein